MPDSEPDLYSFLRSKDLSSPDSEDEERETRSDGSDDGSPGREAQDPDVQVVDSFGDADVSETGEDATLNFEDDDLVDTLVRASRETLHNAPFGVVQVDDDGIVQFYNQYEANLADIDPEDALGKNFFTQLAPCSGNRLFHGRFKKGVRKDNLDERFTYTFTYKMSPTLVDVRMHRDDDGRNWVLVRKR